MDGKIALSKYKRQGLCCAQIMVQLGLDLRNEENEQMVSAMSALCGGFHQGLFCGALSGAAIMLSLFDSKIARKDMIPELIQWFFVEFGSTDCLKILDEDMPNSLVKCGDLMEKTYFYAQQMLMDYGFLTD